jgi:hypothetical protein
MTRFAILSLAAWMLYLPGQALSQEAIANRFTMEKTENGFVRMDTQTGEMSICCRTGAVNWSAGWPPMSAGPSREALSELSARVAALEQRLDDRPRRVQRRRRHPR